MALVELLLSPLPAHVRTARLVIVTAARRARLEDELVDELRFAVGEACSRAVGLHARHAPDVPVRITIEDGPAGLTVSVVDAGPAAGPVPDDVSARLLADHGRNHGRNHGPDNQGPDNQGPDNQGPDSLDGGPDELVDPDVALALLTALVDTATVEPGPTGTTVTMRWPLPLPVRGPGATAVSQV